MQSGAEILRQGHPRLGHRLCASSAVAHSKPGWEGARLR